MKIKQIKITDAEYPRILREISDPPKILYYRGSTGALKIQPAIAVVGTRRCSSYGAETTKIITAGLAKAGVCIVSGMAKGVDTRAHETALEYGARTIAVLGSGIDDKSIYPGRNKKLAHNIIKSGGLILSEYKPGTPGLPHQFPERNRIVAGLSVGTLVTEAPIKSGAMITARLALEYARDVYAVPGSIFSRFSAGCNELIAQGAKCTREADDILKELDINYKMELENTGKTTDALPEKEKMVLKIIEESPKAAHIDKIIQTAKLDADKVAQILTSLMLKDYIKESGANSYIVAK